NAFREPRSASRKGRIAFRITSDRVSSPRNVVPQPRNGFQLPSERCFGTLGVNKDSIKLNEDSLVTGSASPCRRPKSLGQAPVSPELAFGSVQPMAVSPSYAAGSIRHAVASQKHAA